MYTAGILKVQWREWKIIFSTLIWSSLSWYIYLKWIKLYVSLHLKHVLEKFRNVQMTSLKISRTRLLSQRNTCIQLQFIFTFLPPLSKREKEQADRSIFDGINHKMNQQTLLWPKSNVEENGLQTSRGLCRFRRRVWGQRPHVRGPQRSPNHIWRKYWTCEYWGRLYFLKGAEVEISFTSLISLCSFVLFKCVVLQLNCEKREKWNHQVQVSSLIVFIFGDQV